MKELQVNNIFKIFAKNLVSKMGSAVTDNHQLDKVAYTLLGKRFKGTYAQDKLPVNKSGYYIMNVDTSKKSGTHWVAVLSTPKTIYVFDSFGRKSKNLLKVLYDNAKSVNKKVVDADYDIDQHPSTNICGPLSIAFLLTAKQVGIKNALKV